MSRRPPGSTTWSSTTLASITTAPRPASGCARCWACSPTPRSPATTGAPCPAPRPWSWGTTSASSTTTSRTATGNDTTGRRSGPSTASPRRSIPATCCSASAGWPSIVNAPLGGMGGGGGATGRGPSAPPRRKKTLPLIYAFEHAGPDDRERLLALYRDPSPTPGQLAETVAILERTGARDYTRNEARRYRDEALSELDAAGVVDRDARRRLEEIIVSVITA